MILVILAAPAFSAAQQQNASGIIDVYGASNVSPPSGSSGPSTINPAAELKPQTNFESGQTGAATQEIPSSTRETGKPRIPQHVTVRLRAISINLKELARHAARNDSEVVNAIFAFAVGGACVTAGVLFNEKMSEYSYPFYLLGGANILRGSLILALSPDFTEPSLQYEYMPTRTIAKVKSKLIYGTQSFQSLADRSFWLRVLDSTINIGAGAAAIPLFLYRDPHKFDRALDYFVVTGAGVSVLAGIVGLLTRTEAEKRWSAYEEFQDKLKRDWRQRQQSENNSRLEINFVASPVPGGYLALLQDRF